MVRVHQAAGRRHDAVPVGIGIVGKGDVEFVVHPDQAGHRIGRRTIHPDLAVPVGGHEPERRIDGIVHDRGVDAVMFDDRLPEMNSRAAERIDADLHAGRFDQRHVDAIAEIGDVGTDVVVEMRRWRLAGPLVGHPRDTFECRRQIGVGVLFDDRGDVGIGRAAVRRIIFVAAVLRRIVRGRDDDAVGEAARSAFVITEDRVRDHWSSVCSHRDRRS